MNSLHNTVSRPPPEPQSVQKQRRIGIHYLTPGITLNHTVLISVNGLDRPGITSALVNILATYPVTVLDIDQSVIHNLLSWGMLIEVDASACGENGKPDALFKDLLFKAHELELSIKFTPIDDGEL